MSVKKFYSELSGERVEGEIFKSFLFSLVVCSVIALAFYFYSGNLNSIEKAMLALSAISYAMLMPALRQVRAYGEQGHTEGMMIGMTLGMLSGFLAGFFLGATNGMFIGGIFGMAVGISFGSWMGNCCGVMGVMEGAMAGLMGGLMGAMTAVMTINDNVIIMGIVLVLASAFIASSLCYMLYLSAIKRNRALKEHHIREVAVSCTLMLITIILMAFGPRSFLFQ